MLKNGRVKVNVEHIWYHFAGFPHMPLEFM